MKHSKIYLKDYFPFLGEDGRNPFAEYYLPYNMVEMSKQDIKRPTVIVCPGGGYAAISEREAEPIAVHFLTEGFNVFVLTYSVYPNHFPIQLREVAGLMEILYQNADEWNIDLNRILIAGFSAGGHLAANYSTMFDCKEVRECFPESKNVSGTILSYPVITADPADAHIDSINNLTGKCERTAEETEYLSCEKNVKEATPPAFIWHTADDAVVPVANSLLYARALSKAKVPFELHIFPQGEHGLSTSDAQTLYWDHRRHPCYDHDNAWLDYLKKWLRLMNFSD